MYNKLSEGITKHFMLPKEKLLRKKLVDLLKSNHHAKYAQRLKLFDVNIVPLSVDPNFTAAISFDEGVIFVSEGFLQDESVFFQLDMLMRHELSHNLLMHQIRMMHKIGKDIFPELGTSCSIHDLLNIIEDFEISNTRYTDKDKEIVRHTWLNGKEISGLVTEDSRANWINLSVEEMYDQLTAELEEIRQIIINQRDQDYLEKEAGNDFIFHSAKPAFLYMFTVNEPAAIKGTAEEFINNKAFLYLGGNKKVLLKTIRADYAECIKKMYEACADSNSYYYNNKQALLDLIKEISQTLPTTPYEFTQLDTNKEPTGTTIKIIAPEEKFLTIEILKLLAGITFQEPKKSIIHVKKEKHSKEYTDIYNKVIRALGSRDKCSDEELQEIMDAVINYSNAGHTKAVDGFDSE